MKFYYKRDKGCLITVCEIPGEDGVGVGYSRCFHTDAPDTDRGISISKGRAEKALRVKRIGRFKDGSIKYEYWVKEVGFIVPMLGKLYDYFDQFAPRPVGDVLCLISK